MGEFRAPDFDAPIDLEGNVRLLPAAATSKGLFFADPLARAQRASPGVDVFRLAGVAERRFLPFLDYPYADFLRLVVVCAQVVYPTASPGEGLRRLGRAGYRALLESHIGRVVFGIFGVQFEQVLLHGPRGYKVSLSFGDVAVERVGERHVRYAFHGLPGFLETYQVGVVEGAMETCATRGRVLVDIADPANGRFDITWSPRGA